MYDQVQQSNVPTLKVGDIFTDDRGMTWWRITAYRSLGCGEYRISSHSVRTLVEQTTVYDIGAEVFTYTPVPGPEVVVAQQDVPLV